MRVALAALLLVALSCSADPEDSVPATTPVPTSTTTSSPRPSTTTTSPARPRPAWLGTRVLPRRADGFGEVQPTPPELTDRRFETIDLLPPPQDGVFDAVSVAVPEEVLARSTWSPECPVTSDQLRYVTLPFWGFDEQLHTGELLVHADAVDAIVTGFRELFVARFPIEEMRIVRADELDLPPTGDGNNTTAFVCRPARGSSSWSEHAFGRAVDINPFHNPYVRGDLVLPELASAYVDRTDVRPGMVDADLVSGFSSSAWGWGGSWSSSKDFMHVSANGR